MGKKNSSVLIAQGKFSTRMMNKNNRVEKFKEYLIRPILFFFKPRKLTQKLLYGKIN